MFDITLRDVYENARSLASQAMTEIQKVDFQEYSNKVTAGAKSVFEAIGPYSPHVAASLAGVLAAQGLDGLTNPKADKYPWTSLALSAIAGGLVYNKNIENLSVFSQIFLASAFATAIYLGKHPAVNYKHSVRPTEQRISSSNRPSMIVNGVKSPLTPARVAQFEKSARQVGGEIDESMRKAFGPGTALYNCTTTVNGVERSLTPTEEAQLDKSMRHVEGQLNKSMRKAFGPGSAFERAFGTTAC